MLVIRTKFLILVMLMACGEQSKRNDKELMTLVQAERDFSELCAVEGVDNSFSRYFDPNVVYFHQGNQVDFASFIEEQKRVADNTQNNTMLIWEPVFADISSSADFGYTTGPYYFYNHKNDETPSGHGYYSSVWKKNNLGEWKVIIDLGINIPGEPKESITLKTSSNTLDEPSIKNWEKEFNLMITLEKQYCDSLNQSKKSFNRNFLSEEIRLHRLGEFPFVGSGSISEVDESDKVHSYNFINGQLSKAGDLGFTYGKVRISVAKDSINNEINTVYYRVWKKENNADWKIVLDVIGLTG